MYILSIQQYYVQRRLQSTTYTSTTLYKYVQVDIFDINPAKVDKASPKLRPWNGHVSTANVLLDAGVWKETKTQNVATKSIEKWIFAPLLHPQSAPPVVQW